MGLKSEVYLIKYSYTCIDSGFIAGQVTGSRYQWWCAAKRKVNRI